MVELHTNHGIIKIELNAEKAPKSVANFLDYNRIRTDYVEALVDKSKRT